MRDNGTDHHWTVNAPFMDSWPPEMRIASGANVAES